MGNFITKLKSEAKVKEIHHGAVILAIGGEEDKPTEYLYGEDEKVMTLLELEKQIAKREEKVISCDSVVIIQCVGSRQKDRNYCSRICCSQAVKNALKLKELNPQIDVYILFRDMRTYGFREDYYREASNRGIKFIRYEPDDKPQVEAFDKDGKRILRVTVTDNILGERLALSLIHI